LNALINIRFPITKTLTVLFIIKKRSNVTVNCLVPHAEDLQYNVFLNQVRLKEMDQSSILKCWRIR
jgi:hypothetical protein